VPSATRGRHGTPTGAAQNHATKPTNTPMPAVNKTEVIKQFQLSATDTGSSEVQIALLSARIAHLTDHLRTHRKDFHSRRGLIMLTNRRRKLLSYLKDNALEKYNEIIQKLNLRR
jgi:small subunit ribosomal protein S15